MDGKEQVQRTVEAWNSHDREQWIALAAPNVSVNDQEVGVNGWGMIYDAWLEAFPDSTVTISKLFEGGQRTATEFIFMATHQGHLKLGAVESPPTNKHVSFKWCEITSYREDGKIQSLNAYGYVEGLMRCLGRP